MHIKNKHELAPKQSCPMKGCDKTFSTIGNMKVSLFTWCILFQKRLGPDTDHGLLPRQVHIDKFHVPELNHYFKLLEDRDFDSLPEDAREILELLLRIYKNSNRGIKGRGPDGEFEKEEKKRPAVKRQATHQEMTPVSPDANSAIHEYRQYYDQQHQHQYHVLPHPAQQPPQQSAGYLQLPMHQTQHSVYHGLPQPATYNMSWTSGAQYH